MTGTFHLFTVSKVKTGYKVRFSHVQTATRFTLLLDDAGQHVQTHKVYQTGGSCKINAIPSLVKRAQAAIFNA